MKNVIPVVATFVAIFCTGAAYGQNADSEPMSIEELYLSREMSITSAASMIQSNDRDTQLIALKMLADGAETGRFDPHSSEYVAMVGFVLEQGVTTISRNQSRLPDSYHPLLRVEAARALGKSDTGEAVGYLVQAIRNDNEPQVVGAAMLALSETQGVDVGIASLEIALALRREAAIRGDGSMIVSGLAALQRLAERAGDEPLDPVVRETVVSIAAGGFNRAVREQAIAALMAM